MGEDFAKIVNVDTIKRVRGSVRESNVAHHNCWYNTVVEDVVGAMGMSRMALEASYYDDYGHGLNPEIFAALIFLLGEFRG